MVTNKIGVLKGRFPYWYWEQEPWRENHPRGEPISGESQLQTAPTGESRLQVAPTGESQSGDCSYMGGAQSEVVFTMG